MKRFAALVGAGVILGIGGCSSASSPSTPGPTVTVTVTQSAPPTSGGGGLGQGSTSPTSSTAPASDVGVCISPVVTCRGELKTEPKTILVTGDGSEFVTDLVWTGWGLATATGSGTMKIDNCNPNCAQGTFTDYVATVVVSDLTGYTGGAAYATMMVAAPGSPYGTKTYHHLAP